MNFQKILRTVLAFVNVIEPGPEIRLSPTQVGMWAVIFIVPYSAITNPANIAAVLSALATGLPFVLNYMHQRHCKSGPGQNNDDDQTSTPATS